MLDVAKSPIAVTATGPLTNIARLCLGLFHVLPKIRNRTIMGGALSGVHVTTTVEFNFYVDPDAVHVVLKYVSGIRLVGLDETRPLLWLLRDVKHLIDYGPVERTMAHGFDSS